MNSQQNAILEKLAKNHYIQWVTIFSNEAELLNQPIGQWNGNDDINILVGKILYTNNEANACLNQGKIRQIWLTLEQGHFICTSYSSEEILVISANNNGFLGELRQSIELTVKSLQKLSEQEKNPLSEIFAHQEESGTNNFNQQELLIQEELATQEANMNKNSQRRLRGRKFIE